MNASSIEVNEIDPDFIKFVVGQCLCVLFVILLIILLLW